MKRSEIHEISKKYFYWQLDIKYIDEDTTKFMKLLQS